MRHTSPQLPLSAPWIAHAHAAELAAMSALLDEQPALSAGVQQDLEAGCPTNARTGRPGLSGEQTLRLLLVRQLTGWTYAELAFHLADSLTYRAFCRVSALSASPSKSVSVSAHVERWRDGTSWRYGRPHGSQLQHIESLREPPAAIAKPYAFAGSILPDRDRDSRNCRRWRPGSRASRGSFYSSPMRTSPTCSSLARSSGDARSHFDWHLAPG